jgi:ABC-type uncharacterized transport system permease subunit
MTLHTLLHILSLAAYGAGFGLSLSGFARRSSPTSRRAVWFIGLGVALQGAGLLTYARASGIFPAARPFGFFSLYALLAFVASLLACRHWDIGPAGFLLQVIPLATAAAVPILPDHGSASHLPPLLLGLHLVAVLVALVAFTLAFSGGLMLFVQDRLIKAKSTGFLMESLPPLSVLDEVTYQNIALGFAFLSLAALLGMAGAATGLGSQAFLNTKVALSTAVWVLYGYYLHSRLRSGWRGRKLALVALAGFVVVAATSLVASFFPMGGPLTGRGL